MAKRQVEVLAAPVAFDVEEFYATRTMLEVIAGAALVISADGKGIFIRPGALRPAIAKAAATAINKLESRLSKGAKRSRGRLTEIGTVHDITPLASSPGDVLSSKSDDDPPERRRRSPSR